MNPRLYRYLQVLVALGLAFFLLDRFATGKLLWYINARFVVLTVLGIVGLIAMSANALEHLRITRRLEIDEGHEEHSYVPDAVRWNLFLLALPLIFGLLIPAQPLGVDAAASRGVVVSAPLASGDVSPGSLAAAPDERNILDWIRIFNYESDLALFLGEPANVIGFIYRDPRLTDGQFMVSRFAVSCCVADAFAIGLIVDWPETASLPEDGWVDVTGTIDTGELNGQRVPLLRADSVTLVDPPAQPYLFP
ncbi:MAG: TIGR03943 family protein [Chloroflexota bacterium]